MTKRNFAPPRFLLLAVSSTTLFGLLGACGGEDLSCGEGTKKSGSQCIAVAQDMSSIGGAGGAGGAPAVVEGPSFEFDGALALAPASATSLLATWTPLSVDGEEATYNIYVATTEDGFNFSSPQAEAPAGATAFLLSGLDADTEYFVVVRAVIDGEEDDNEVSRSATTQEDTEPPEFVGADSAEPDEAAAVKLTWKPATDALSSAGAMIYVVYMGTTADDVDLEVPVAVSRPGATSIVVDKLPAPDTEYFFLVRARDAAGNFDDNEVIVSGKSGKDLTPPKFGGCTLASGKTARSVEALWNAATDDTSAPEEISYNIYVSKKSGEQNFSVPGATIVGDERGIVPDLETATDYYVVCRAVDASGNEAENFVEVTATTKSDDEAPEFQGVTNILNITPTGFDVEWNPGSDNQTAEDALVYQVYVSETSGGHDFSEDSDDLKATSMPGATGVTVAGLGSNTDYYVVVRALDLAENQSQTTVEFAVTTFVSFAADIESPIFGQRCATATCHEIFNPTAGMKLAPGWAYNDLVGDEGLGVDANTSVAYEFYDDDGLKTPMKRVKPGDSARSFILKRVDPPVLNPPLPGDFKMPPTGDDLAPAQIELIQLWIDQGAQNN